MPLATNDESWVLVFLQALEGVVTGHSATLHQKIGYENVKIRTAIPHGYPWQQLQFQTAHRVQHGIVGTNGRMSDLCVTPKARVWVAVFRIRDEAKLVRQGLLYRQAGSKFDLFLDYGLRLARKDHGRVRVRVGYILVFGP
jgi:hypothetical protein